MTKESTASKPLTRDYGKKDVLTQLFSSDLEAEEACDQAYGTLYHDKSGFRDLLSLNNGPSWAFHKSQIGQRPQSQTLHKSISTKLELLNLRTDPHTHTHTMWQIQCAGYFFPPPFPLKKLSAGQMGRVHVCIRSKLSSNYLESNNSLIKKKGHADICSPLQPHKFTMRRKRDVKFLH